MKKVLLSLILIFTLDGCTTTNPDGSSTVGMKGSILWIINAPIKYSIEYLNGFDTWKICEIWDRTLSTAPYIGSNPQYSKSEGLRTRERLAKTLESRGEDPMVCRK